VRKVFFIVLLLGPLKTMSQLPNKDVSFLALGDSYTIGESVSEQERWPNQLADSLRAHGMKISRPTLVATTGWRTDDLKNAIAKASLKNEYGLVSLLIGVNNQYQGKPLAQYAVEFEDLLRTAIALAQGKKENVFVVSIPDYGFTPFGKEKQTTITAAIDQFNATNRQIAERLGITYFFYHRHYPPCTYPARSGGRRWITSLR
jgi:lysophospholipase L1-like esterase